MSSASKSILPDLPGKVHGIKALHPYKVQCDGCGHLITHDGKEALTTFFGWIRFHRPSPGALNPRLCGDCWGARGVRLE